MKFSNDTLQDFIKRNFLIEAEVSALPGELDLNYFVRSSQGHSFILKIANLNELRQNLELQNAVINHLVGKHLGLHVSNVVKSVTGNEIIEIKAII